MVKNTAASAGDSGDTGSVSRSGRSRPRGGNDNPLQESCLRNPGDRGAWWATVHGNAESDTTEHACKHAYIVVRESLELVRWRNTETFTLI